MEEKEKVLENLEKLKNILEKRIENGGKNRCYWDMKKCPFYSEIKGLEDAGTRCVECGRLADRERLFSVFREIAPDFIETVKLEQVTGWIETLEEKKQSIEEETQARVDKALEEAYTEINEQISEFLEKLEKK
jgi:DNA-binding transcriptional MerR regulator